MCGRQLRELGLQSSLTGSLTPPSHLAVVGFMSVGLWTQSRQMLIDDRVQDGPLCCMRPGSHQGSAESANCGRTDGRLEPKWSPESKGFRDAA